MVERSARHIVVYGKGGIGKTTVATNLAEAMQDIGYRSMIIGCSPKTSLIDAYFLSDDMMPVLELKRSTAVTDDNFDHAFHVTPQGIILLETGGPEPGIGCAGVGLPVAFREIEAHRKVIPDYDQVNYVFYDLIGDIVCGGFSTPLRGGDREVIVVASGELMAIYAANNILRGISAMGGRIKILGMVLNERGVTAEREVVEAFSERTNVPILARIPRDVLSFKEAAQKGGPLVRVMPESSIATTFRELAERLDKDPVYVTPKPIEKYDELFELFMAFQRDQITQNDVSYEAYQKRIPSELVSRPVAKRIAIYGTGGIGKSTTSTNVTAALVLLGERVFQLGCDPKRDSIANLCRELKPTYLDALAKLPSMRGIDRDFLTKLIFPGDGFNGDRVFGAECGGPPPGRGCGGKGVDLSMKLLEENKVLDPYGFTFILYDVLGDTVCGGFARPLNFAPQVYIVTSGEVPSMTQALKIAQSVDAAAGRGVPVGIGGIINNMRGVPHEREIVEEVFGAVGLPVAGHIPRSDLVQKSENFRTTVVQAFVDSEQTVCYVELARQIQANEDRNLLKRPILSTREVMEIVRKYE